FIEPHRPLPTAHLNHPEITTKLQLLIKEPREFADRHSVSHWNSMVNNERKLIGISDGTFDLRAADGVRPIKHKHRPLSFGGLFHHVAECRDVSVKACANVLNI